MCVCWLQTVRREGQPLKDQSRASDRHTERAMSATGPQKEQRLFKAACAMHHSDPAPPTHCRGQPINGSIVVMYATRFMGVRVPQCLATITLKLLLLIIKDHTLALPLSLYPSIYCRTNLLMDAATL